MSITTKKAIGVEIDDKEIRAVELQQRKNKIYLSQYDRISLPSGVVEDGKISKLEELGIYIKQLWIKNKFKKKNIILGLANQDVMIRKISLPQIPKEKLDLLISNHAQEYIPFPIDDCVLDYMIVGKKEASEIKQVDILLAAAQLPMIEDFYQCFSRVGLKIIDIKISSLAILDIIEKENKGIVIFIDIPNNLGSLVTCVDGSPKFARILRVNLAQATGLDPANTTAKMELLEIVLSTWSQILYNQIRSSIQYFQTYEDVSSIDKIILSGCGSRIMGLDKALENSINIPVELINPMQKIETSPDLPINEDIIDYSTCIGLALAGLE